MQDRFAHHVAGEQQWRRGVAPHSASLGQLTERSVELEEANILWSVDHRERDSERPRRKIRLDEHDLEEVESLPRRIELSKQPEHANDVELVRPVPRCPTSRKSESGVYGAHDQEHSADSWEPSHLTLALVALHRR